MGLVEPVRASRTWKAPLALLTSAPVAASCASAAPASTAAWAHTSPRVRRPRFVHHFAAADAARRTSVKSIDLDIWTPEQMASVQKWGNRRANAYWEAHLKAGHVPPEHKIESFIRSKVSRARACGKAVG